MARSNEGEKYAQTPKWPAAKIVLIGCGAVARLFYAPALIELERNGIAEVCGLVDPSPTSVRLLAKAFPRARVFDKTDVPFAADANLAIIASPPKLHCQHTTAALAAGMNVLCEKPMAGSVQDCETMIEAARTLGRILAVGHYKRFFPAHRAIKHFIQHQVLGPLQSVVITEGGKFAWPASSDSFFRMEQTPGGVLLDIGVHVLDLLLWWLGDPAKSNYTDDALDGMEANALLSASFLDGVTATVRLSRDWETLNTYVFKFERATVHLRVNQANHAEVTFDGLRMTFAAELRDVVNVKCPLKTPALETNSQAFVAQLVDVIASMHEGREPLVTGTEGIRAIRWIDQCYQNRQSLAMPWI